MAGSEYIFWISCCLIFYNYFGYALIVYFLNSLFGKKKADSGNDYLPTVTFIVAAFNEEDHIKKKVINSLEQDYPSDKIEYIFVTDGSTDQTSSIISQFAGIQLLHRKERMGKSAAINRAVKQAGNEILIFSDANTILNKDATKNIVRHYSDLKTGGVAGEKRVIKTGLSEDAVASEGLYWKYESFLKKIDSEFYSVVGAAGELFSLRRELYEPVNNKVILDDFVISLKVAQKGYRFVYEPGAYAMELPSFSMQDEQKRKIRIAAGGFQAIGMLWKLLLFWRSPRLSFLYISHRVLRWTSSPVCLILALVSNFILVLDGKGIVYNLLFCLQVLFYLASFLAYWSPENSKWHKMFKVAYYFVFMHISVIQGFFRFLQGKQSAVWEKAKRNKSVLLESHISES